MRLKKLIRDYFSFSRTEINGTLVLIPVIVFLLFTPYLYRQIMDPDNHTLAEDKRLLDSLVFLIEDQYGIGNTKEEKPIEYFPFNPNEASLQELMSLGIPKYISTRITNYRSKGGRFLVKKDLLRIYDFPDSLFQRLEAYIELPGRKTIVAKSTKQPGSKVEPAADKPVELNTKPVEFLYLDINKADSVSLKRLKGIGSSYAKRIISYKKLLGGYHSIQQLKEVYGMTDDLYASISPHFTLSDSIPLRMVSINLATFKELLAHPYISYEQTKEILNVKSERGKFREANDMFRLKLMDSLTMAKLLPYLNF